ncbi:C-GCAxxG-C-C family protein [Anaeroselena agilis]|uniref:C-GCAxxG-C-C family protein n=1 Tax=Anaeroselena agilis TaxID=3063788 RepID=A0ABU3P5M0_9FIRM|nr:C-GCAxxG-C-C family protein [Selenomonadales bacterium 4137-cl]
MDLKQWVAGEVHRCYWEDNVNCARTVLAILAELGGQTLHPQVVAAATGMHGAGGFRAQCGLVEGALMYIGIAGAERGLNDEEVGDRCREFAEEFTAAFGSLLCRELRPEGFADDLPTHLCEPRSVDAAMFAVEFMRAKGLIRG